MNGSASGSGVRAGPRRIPLHLGSDPGARLSLRSVRRTLGHAAERVIDPTVPPPRVSNPSPHASAWPAAPGAANEPLLPRISRAHSQPPRISAPPPPLPHDIEIAGPDAPVWAAGTLRGDPVIGPAGETLGTIRDVMIDLHDGQVAYAVLSCGGARGFADRLYAVPWSALTLDPERRRFQLNITREVLLMAPNFDEKRWPDMSESFFARTVHAYYGRPGYWEQET